MDLARRDNPAAIRTPCHFASDRECLERMAPTVGRLDLKAVTYAWIPNSLEIGFLAMSENLKAEIKATPHLEIVSDPFDFEFDARGDLSSMSQVAAKIGVTDPHAAAYTAQH